MGKTPDRVRAGTGSNDEAIQRSGIIYQDAEPDIEIISGSVTGVVLAPATFHRAANVIGDDHILALKPFDDVVVAIDPQIVINFRDVRAGFSELGMHPSLNLSH